MYAVKYAPISLITMYGNEMIEREKYGKKNTYSY